MPKKSLKRQRKQRISRKRIGKRRTIRGGVNCFGLSCMTSIPKTPPEEFVDFFNSRPIFDKEKKSKELLEGFLKYIKGIQINTPPTSNEEEFLGFITSIQICIDITNHKIPTADLYVYTKLECANIVLNSLQRENAFKHYFGNINIEGSPDINSFIEKFKNTTTNASQIRHLDDGRDDKRGNYYF